MKRVLITIFVIVFMSVSFESQANPLGGALADTGTNLVEGITGKATPVVVKGASALIKGSFVIVKDALGVIWLPIGVTESTLGAPFGFFAHGLTDMVDGVAAPFKVVGDVIVLPFQVTGIANIN